MIVRKTGWSIPASSKVQILAGFTDGSSITLVGQGEGNSIEFDLSGEQLRSWVHEITSSVQMQLVFGGSEPPWSFDLTGSSTVVNAMGLCFREHGVSGLSPPFGQPPVTVGSDTQPIGLPSFSTLPVPGMSPASERMPFTGSASPATTNTSSTVSSSLPLPATALPATSDQVIVSWHGTGNMQTRPFHVDSPWELQWRNEKGLFSVTLHPAGGSSSRDILVANGAEAGSSSAYQPTAGDFYLEIEADEPWTMRAVLVPPTQGASVTPTKAPGLEKSLIPVDGDQSGLPACDGPDASDTVKHLVEKSASGQTFHIEVLHVGAPQSIPVEGGGSVCTVTLITNAGELTYGYQIYRKDGEVYVFGKTLDK